MFTALVRCAVALAIGCAVAPAAIAQTLPAQSWPDRPIRIADQLSAGRQHGRHRAHCPAGAGEAAGPADDGREPSRRRRHARDRRRSRRRRPTVTRSGSSGAGALAGNVALGEKMTYDPRKDLAPVTALVGIALHAGGAAVVCRQIAARRHRAGEAGQAFDRARRQRHADASHRRDVQPDGRHQAADGSLQGHRAGGDRPDRRSCRARDRRSAVGGGGDRRRQAQSWSRFRRRSAFRGSRTFRPSRSRGFQISSRSAGSGSSRQPETPPAVIARLNSAIVAELKEPVGGRAHPCGRLGTDAADAD